MYRYEITEAVATSVRRIEELRTRLDAQGPLPRIWLGRTRRDLEAEAVAASTIMEGVAVTVDEARRILAGDKPPGVSVEDIDLVDGYRDAMRFVLARADADAFQWHSELMLSLHHLVLGGSYANGAGRFRGTQNWLTNRANGAQVYLPPPAEKVPSLVNDLAAWLQGTAEPGPVTSALAHVSVAGIHPFADGNGRTARIVASLAMYRAGFRLPQFTSLEEWWGRHLEDYYSAFDCLGAEWAPNTDVTPFLETHVQAQVAQVEALSLRNTTERALWTVLQDIAVIDMGLNERTTHALYDAFFARDVTNRYYRGMADVSEVTASHDLGKLVASGALEPKGAGRSARYVAAPALYELVVQHAELDPRWLGAPGDTVAQRDAVLMGLANRLHVTDA
ncbi:MAG: Fic family protein [Actinobacteria bacterium]|nr:Fic family protein [Actinomycetota bacterium]MCG2807020.1 Fic family protein [Coriobacteriia bacterium]